MSDQEEFDKYADFVLSDPKEIIKLRKQIHDLVDEFADKLLAKNYLILEMIKVKRALGKKEHGQPLKNISDIEDEVHKEIMDSFIWQSMRNWRKNETKR